MLVGVGCVHVGEQVAGADAVEEEVVRATLAWARDSAPPMISMISVVMLS